MSQKWNLQDIRPVEPKKRRPVAPPAHIDEEKEEDEVINITQPPKNNVPHTPFRHKSEKKSRTVLYAAIVFFVIVGSALGLSAVLGKTELTIQKRLEAHIRDSKKATVGDAKLHIVMKAHKPETFKIEKLATAKDIKENLNKRKRAGRLERNWCVPLPGLVTGFSPGRLCPFICMARLPKVVVAVWARGT